MNSDKKNKVWLTIMNFGSIMGCHQMAERSFFLKTYQFPICARCTGIAIGQFLAIILITLKVKINIFFSIFSLLVMIIDGGLQYFNYLKSTNYRRIITGILGGMAYINIIAFIIKFISLKITIKRRY